MWTRRARRRAVDFRSRPAGIGRAGCQVGGHGVPSPEVHLVRRLSPKRRVRKDVRPSTLLQCHQALVRRKYRRLFSSSPRPKKPGPKGPSEALIRAIVELKTRKSSVSGVLGLRASFRGRSGSTSIRTCRTASCRNTIVRHRTDQGRHGCRSSDTPQTASGVWTCFDANPLCYRATGC